MAPSPGYFSRQPRRDPYGTKHYNEPPPATRHRQLEAPSRRLDHEDDLDSLSSVHDGYGNQGQPRNDYGGEYQPSLRGLDDYEPYNRAARSKAGAFDYEELGQDLDLELDLEDRDIENEFPLNERRRQGQAPAISSKFLGHKRYSTPSYKKQHNDRDQQAHSDMEYETVVSGNNYRHREGPVDAAYAGRVRRAPAYGNGELVSREVSPEPSPRLREILERAKYNANPANAGSYGQTNLPSQHDTALTPESYREPTSTKTTTTTTTRQLPTPASSPQTKRYPFGGSMDPKHLMTPPDSNLKPHQTQVLQQQQQQQQQPPREQDSRRTDAHLEQIERMYEQRISAIKVK